LTKYNLKGQWPRLLKLVVIMSPSVICQAHYQIAVHPAAPEIQSTPGMTVFTQVV